MPLAAATADSDRDDSHDSDNADEDVMLGVATGHSGGGTTADDEEDGEVDSGDG